MIKAIFWFYAAGISLVILAQRSFAGDPIALLTFIIIAYLLLPTKYDPAIQLKRWLVNDEDWDPH